MTEENKRRDLSQSDEQDQLQTKLYNSEDGLSGQDEEEAIDHEAAIQSNPSSVRSDNAPKRSDAGGWIAAAILLVAFVVVAIKAFSTSGEGGTEAVAEVNGVKITQQQLYKSLITGGNGEKALENLISYELVNQEAEEKGVKVTEEDINHELEGLKTNMGGEESFNLALQQYGMTVEDLKPDLRQQAQYRKLLEPQVSVSDEDISSYFEQYKDSFATPEQVRASHILVATKEEADEIIKQLNEGSDFAAIAKEKSLDTSNKDAGGDLDYFSRGMMEAAFEEAAFNLKVGEISEPVQTSYGYHVIKVTDHKEATTPTLEDKKDEIKETLTTQQVYQLSQTLLSDLRSQAKIENYLSKDTEEAAE
ncbi:peptidylprolyl isomerase [Paenibacillus xylaniclasticus]|uniref:peptidylprolyl isomerase n=1 Tax=Paenibacillus xylaniclasticus TaxID=588083 RepID=UPI000FDCAE1A|nr:MULTISPECIES: peptidylprolyl isomerase [Paenibacillus]GFN33338.1 peptidylprolyl isomerase [Paenibacillus curdlanolyticus]